MPKTDENGVVLPTEDIVEPTEGQPDPLDTITDVEELRKAAKANRSIAGRYKKKLATPAAPVAPVAPANQNLPTPPKPEGDDVSGRIGKLELSEKKRSFGHEHQLSPGETDNLFAFANGRNLSPEEALKDPFFVAGLAETRRAERIAQAIPPSSNRSTKVEGKTFAEMSPEEREKNWPKITQGKRK